MSIPLDWVYTFIIASSCRRVKLNIAMYFSNVAVILNHWANKICSIQKEKMGKMKTLFLFSGLVLIVCILVIITTQQRAQVVVLHYLEEKSDIYVSRATENANSTNLVQKKVQEVAESVFPATPFTEQFEGIQENGRFIGSDRQSPPAIRNEENMKEITTVKVFQEVPSSFIRNQKIFLEQRNRLKNKVKNFCNDGNNYKQNKLVLSYSFFGENWKRYGRHIAGTARNALTSSFFSQWSVRIYHDNLPEELQESLTNMYENLFFCDIRQVTLPFYNEVAPLSSINGMVWRFIPMADPAVDVMCSRDLDSEWFKREADAVGYWLEKTNKSLHVIRDHYLHHLPILGGLWCYRNIKNKTLATSILDCMINKAEKRIYKNGEAHFGSDQLLLIKCLWKVTKDDSLQHDSYACETFSGSTPYNTQRSNNWEFIGCRRGCAHRKLQKHCPVACRPKKHQDWLYC